MANRLEVAKAHGGVRSKISMLETRTPEIDLVLARSRIGRAVSECVVQMNERWVSVSCQCRVLSVLKHGRLAKVRYENR